MRVFAFSLFFASIVACGGAFTTPGEDAGPGGGTGTGGQAGGIGGFGGDLGGYPVTGGFAGELGGVGIAGDNGGHAGSFGGMAGQPATGGGAGAAGAADAGVDFGACNGPGQCILMPVSCCGVCGESTAADYVAINSSSAAAFQKQQCPVALPCPACATAIDPSLGARCVQGRCQVFDVRTAPEYSSCQTPDDCILRSGTGCCGCTGNGWVAVSRSGSAALLKDECASNTACPACTPVPPASTFALCIENMCNLQVLNF